FFFQAEDGIRDFHVTGVQTCALPICRFWFPQKISHTALHNLCRVVYTIGSAERSRHDPHPPRQPRPPDPPRPRELAIRRLERRHPPRLPRLHRLLRRRLEPQRTRMAALLRRTPRRGRAPRRLGLPRRGSPRGLP